MNRRALLIMVIVGLLLSAAVTSATPLPAYLPCGDAASGHVRLARAPTRCTVLPTNASFSEGANLAGLHWQNWGGATAAATGIERGFHLPLTWIRVKVTAFALTAPGYCTGHFRVYKRLRVSSRYGTRVVRTEGCAI